MKILSRSTKRIYVKGFDLHTNLADGQAYIEVVLSEHPEATPVDVPQHFQAVLIYGKSYMLCLDRFGNCV